MPPFLLPANTKEIDMKIRIRIKLMTPIFICVYLLTLAMLAFGQQKTDPTAYDALRDTRATRYYFTRNLAGFTADLTINDNGKVSTARLTYGADEGIDLRFQSPDESREPWVLEMVTNMLGHRRPASFIQGDGRWPIKYADDDKSPAGRKVLLNDPMNSSYRIRDGRVTEVNRSAGDQRFIISIMEEIEAEPGRYLPRHFTVTYFDAKTGAIKRTDSFTDEYGKVRGVWVPVSRRLIQAKQGSVITRFVEFKNPQVRLMGGQ
jgi:hypothetical protein